MESEGRYAVVGIVVLAVATLLGIAVFWLAGTTDRIAYQAYTIYFSQQSLDGLAVGSAVKMRGIKIGVVDGYRFAQDGEEAVSVTARVDKEVPIHKGAAAYIKRNLVTGIASVEINNGPAEGGLLDAAPEGERYPVIAEGRSDIDKVTTAFSRMGVNGAQVLEKMNAMLSDDNQKTFNEILDNLNELTGHLNANKARFDETLQGVRDATDEFRFAGASIGQAASRAEGSMVSIQRNADAALQEAATTLIGLRMDASDISQHIQRLSETGALEIGNISRDIRSSADAFTAAGQELANPRAILFGPSREQLGPGEKLP